MITASIVLFKTPPELFTMAMRSFLDGTHDGLLIISDNSPEPIRHSLFAHPRVCYLFNGANLGFGKGHNKAIRKLPPESEFHLMLNPDVRFDPDVISQLVQVMGEDPATGAAMPRVVYPDGSFQNLCKLLPTPLDLIIRRFIPFEAIRRRINARYELHDLPQTSIIEVPTLSGCFLLLRTSLLKTLSGFDERYFMYMEDVDLIRRIGDHAKTVYVPNVSIIHEYAKGSYFNKKLLGHHLVSAMKYFHKWGWWFDRVRAERNRKILSTIKICSLPQHPRPNKVK